MADARRLMGVGVPGPTAVEIADQISSASGSTVTATTTQAGLVNAAAARADSTATDVDGVNTVLNDLLAKLRTAGILAT